ncbi:hypothetical protein RJT34_17483 [Clitoria ternatea]|uniref:Uncharacterized protein n=1 Tax=Clitoria ternatea TaxID=43366 RepID=A0AAN9JC57_CLITE
MIDDDGEYDHNVDIPDGGIEWSIDVAVWEGLLEISIACNSTKFRTKRLRLLSERHGAYANFGSQVTGAINSSLGPTAMVV